MKTFEEIKKILAEHKEEIREKYGVVIIGVFGSYARGEQKETSDIDILVKIERPIGLKFFELWDYIEEILGVNVDLLTPESLKQKPMLWESVKGDLAYV
ncbi:MAG TPA: nucleotidyltransferase [bacterium]|nr:nucleotidyltransferase [bacterium]